MSDIKQTEENKTGISRQTNSNEVTDLLAKFEKMPQIWMNDAGLSAHHGHNITKGRMGNFVEACNKGEIAPGSILVLEYLDRLTRLELNDALHLANSILRAGVIIHVWGSNETIKSNDLSDTIKLVVELQSANAYTKKLSCRIKKSAIIRIHKALDGDKHKDKDGHMLAVNGYGSNAWWIDTTSGYVKPHKIYWEIAREIIDLNLLGWGWQKIAKLFKKKGHLPPRADSKNAKVAAKNKKLGWNRSNLLSKLAKQKAVLGIKEFENLDIEIPDYYPALVTEDEFFQIKKMRNIKKVGGNKKNAALFSGVGKTRCAFCGSTINTSPSKSGTKYETRVYKCSGIHNPEINCPSGTINSIYFETAIIKACGILISQPVKEENKLREYQIDEEINVLDREISNQRALLKISKSLEVIAMVDQDLTKATNKKHKLEKELHALKYVHEPDAFTLDDIPHDIVDYTNTKVRQKYRDIFFSNIKEIKVKINRNVQSRRNKNLVSFAIELYNGNILKTGLYGNQFMKMPDKQYDDIHKAGGENGIVNLYANSSSWHGISRQGKVIDFVDLDFGVGITKNNWTSFDHICKLLVERIRGGEKILV
ncbi:MAG: recombinase family protein [Colwellia sp.]|nr:recombinase family protein [Colwellia sp.]